MLEMMINHDSFSVGVSIRRRTRVLNQARMISTQSRQKKTKMPSRAAHVEHHHEPEPV